MDSYCITAPNAAGHSSNGPESGLEPRSALWVRPCGGVAEIEDKPRLTTQFAGAAFGTASRSRIEFKRRSGNQFPTRSVLSILGPMIDPIVHNSEPMCSI